jgi:hypothetical protein
MSNSRKNTHIYEVKVKVKVRGWYGEVVMSTCTIKK